jgi:DNA-binding NtrC family response regulator
MCDERRFREDLYFRINVVQINLPPLRDRGNDILLIARQLLARYCQKLNKPALTLSAAAEQAILQYTWPGNVRELDNVIQRAVILCDHSERLDADQLDIQATETTSNSRSIPSASGSSSKPAIAQESSLDDYFVRFVLDNQSELSETDLAQRLGISRKNLWERRQKLGIPKPRGGKKQ